MLHYFRPVVLALLLAGVTAVAGCHKDFDVAPAAPTSHGTTAPADSTSLVGRWELTRTEGGIAGVTIPADPARKQEIVFDIKGQATFLLNGTATCTSAYTVVKDSTTYGYGGQKVDAVSFGSTSCRTGMGSYYMIIVNISATEAVLAEPFSDAFYYRYIRR